MNTFSYFDRLEKHSAFYSPTGNGTIEEYQLKYDKDTGTEVLVKIGIRNTQEEIQSFAESANITNIIQRFVNGETDLLHSVDGTYGDFRDAPKSYAEYFQRVREAKKIFEQLPQDIRNKFDDDPEKFFLEFGTDSFVTKINDLDDPTTEVNEPMNDIKEVFDNAE